MSAAPKTGPREPFPEDGSHGSSPEDSSRGPSLKVGARKPFPEVGARRGGLLRHRDFRLLWIGQGTSKFGSSVTSVALPLVAVATLGASAFQTALLSAAVWLPWLLIGLPAGAWVDRLPRRPVMLVCDAASLLMFVSVPVAAGLGVLSIGHLLAVAFGTGLAAVFFETAYQVYLPTLLPRDQLPEGNAKLLGTEAVAQVAGPGAAGLVVQVAGSAVTALLLDAASFLVSALCLLGIRAGEPERKRERRSSTLRHEIAEGIRFVAKDPYLRVLTVFGAASNLGLVGYQAVLVVFLVREVGASPGVVGGVVAGMSLGGVIGAAVATRIAHRLGTARGMLVCALVAMPSGLLIPLARPGLGLAPVVAGGLLVGAGVVAGNVIKGSWRQVYTPHHLLGRVVSSTRLVNLGTIPIGAVLAGILGTAIGLRPAMWLLTGLLALTWLILLIGPLRRHRDLPNRPDLPLGDNRDPALLA